MRNLGDDVVHGSKIDIRENRSNEGKEYWPGALRVKVPISHGFSSAVHAMYSLILPIPLSSGVCIVQSSQLKVAMILSINFSNDIDGSVGFLETQCLHKRRLGLA